MDGVIVFSLLSLAVFTLPWAMEWHWSRLLKGKGVDFRSLTNTKRWLAYAACGSSAIVIWAAMYLVGYVPHDVLAVTLVGAIMVAFGIFATLRTVVDVRPACRRASEKR